MTRAKHHNCNRKKRQFKCKPKCEKCFEPCNRCDGVLDGIGNTDSKSSEQGNGNVNTLNPTRNFACDKRIPITCFPGGFIPGFGPNCSTL